MVEGGRETWMDQTTERGYQRVIEEAAGYQQWITIHVGDSNRDDAGRPDLTLGHFTRNRLVVMEIKDEQGETSPAQRVWLDLHANAGIETYLVLPCHWEEVRTILGSFGRPLGMSCEWPVRTTAEHERDLIRMLEDKARNSRKRRKATARSEWNAWEAKTRPSQA